MGIDAVRFFATSSGNDFMIEIARMLAEGLRAQGIVAEVAIDTLPVAVAGQRVIQIVVAPHEFYPLFLRKRCTPLQIFKITRASYLLNTEQPGSNWFELAAEPARFARGVLDINQQGVAEFVRRGIPAIHAPLGYVASLEATAAPDCSRPIDILFLASYSPRRELFLSRHANFLNTYACRLILARLDRPRLSSTPGFYTQQPRNKLLRESKILINVHSDDRTYFEWHRVLLALANRCLVISETSDQIEPLINGRHLIVTGLTDIVAACRYYLEHEAERSAIAERAYQFMTRDLCQATLCRSWLEALP